MTGVGQMSVVRVRAAAAGLALLAGAVLAAGGLVLADPPADTAQLDTQTWTNYGAVLTGGTHRLPRGSLLNLQKNNCHNVI